MIDAVEFFSIYFIFCIKLLFILFHFISFYLGVLRDDNPVAGL